ncbi:pentatricopeptide repeat-containing protein ELI1 chloroplastic isoform X1 [Prunus yedoensis var. nudiflora]|uniref:Pentatricopeptide repeat-containing protein ELI1 chloroplastic isoform X1 n=1 Tax=Prunus yedoensis var. nudiflora TaxID=2094558 RepID=A0A314UXH2_PRUYE|nr:pentatricopeptide repeat-containing protein ELI1 chloroplastic isoform X1 [Prunus yedoensis var. nudiflora]
MKELSRIECSKRLFEENASSRDVVSWNSMLTAFVRDEQIGAAEKLFEEMPERDVISWSTMISLRAEWAVRRRVGVF